MTDKTYKCWNRHCRAPVEEPGRCEDCASMWENTLKIAQEAYEQSRIRSILGIGLQGDSPS